MDSDSRTRFGGFGAPDSAEDSLERIRGFADSAEDSDSVEDSRIRYGFGIRLLLEPLLRIRIRIR